MDKKLVESMVIKLFQNNNYITNDACLDVDTVERIINDIDVNSALNKINRGVSGKQYMITTDTEELKKDLAKVDSIFKNVKFNRTFNHILKARLYGFSCFEIIYNENYGVGSLVPIPHRNVFYDYKTRGWKIKIGTDSIEIDYEKFLLCIHDWNPGNPTGQSILKSCNMTFLDKSLFQNQLRNMSSKYGDTIILFPYDPREDDELIKKRAEGIKKAKGGNVIGVPVEFNSQAGNLENNIHFIKLSDLDPEIYTRLADREKEKLMQNILGSTLTMSVGDKGTQALGTVHMEAEQQVIDEATAFISDSLQNLLESVGLVRGEDLSQFYFLLVTPYSEIDNLSLDKEKTTINGMKIDNFLKLQQTGYEVTIEGIAEAIGLDISQIKPLEIKEFSKKKDLNSLLEKQAIEKDKILEQGEIAFLNKFQKSINKEVIEYIEKLKSGKIGRINLDFESFYQHALTMQLTAETNEYYVKEFEEVLNPFEVKFSEAIANSLSKKPELFNEIDSYEKKVKDNVFWIKKSTDIKVTERILNSLQNNLSEGGTFKEWKKDIDGIADKAGLAEDGWYAANVYRTNMATFYSAGEYNQQIENIQNKPYWLYNGISDSRQSKICQELDGKVYKADDEIWGRIYPPNHHMCRSKVTALDKDDLEEYKLKVERPPEKIKNMQLGNFKGNPAENYWKSLGKNVEKSSDDLDIFIRDLNIRLWTKENNLTEEETSAIIGYVGGDYLAINNELRDGKLTSKKVKEMVPLIDSGLDKLPSYTGTVTRSLSLYNKSFDEFISEIEKNENKEYLSVTAGKPYNENSNVQITIESEKGKNIRYFNMDEQEIIYPRGSKFKVKKEYRFGNKLFLTLMEVN